MVLQICKNCQGTGILTILGYHSLFIKWTMQSIFVALIVYVDDIIIFYTNVVVMIGLKDTLSLHLKLCYLGILKYFLGIEIAHSKSCILISQRKYAMKLL